MKLIRLSVPCNDVRPVKPSNQKDSHIQTNGHLSHFTSIQTLRTLQSASKETYQQHGSRMERCSFFLLLSFSTYPISFLLNLSNPLAVLCISLSFFFLSFPPSISPFPVSPLFIPNKAASRSVGRCKFLYRACAGRDHPTEPFDAFRQLTTAAHNAKIVIFPVVAKQETKSSRGKFTSLVPAKNNQRNGNLIHLNSPPSPVAESKFVYRHHVTACMPNLMSL